MDYQDAIYIVGLRAKEYSREGKWENIGTLSLLKDRKQ
jgi:hypothetical protein